jgi:cytochrome c biogenesis protein CcmG/thiol:disulfide interchange protein DsbE
MIKNIKFIIIILFSLFIFLIFLKGLEKPNNYLPEKNSNKIETNLSAKMLYDQKEVLLGELINNNSFSIINIWASWCLPCRDEHAYLLNLKKVNNINIIGINYKDKKSNAIKFLRDLGNPYSEVLIDPDGTKSIELGAFGIPETYLVNNKNKEIIKKYIGPLDDVKFKEILKIIKNEKN